MTGQPRHGTQTELSRVYVTLSLGGGIGPKRVSEMLWKLDRDLTAPPTSSHAEPRSTPDSSDTGSQVPGRVQGAWAGEVTGSRWPGIKAAVCSPKAQPVQASQDAAVSTSPAQQGSGGEEIEIFLKLLMLFRVSQTHCLGKVLLKTI